MAFKYKSRLIDDEIEEYLEMIGAILNALLTQVLNNPELNEYEKLEELALKIYQEVQ